MSRINTYTLSGVAGYQTTTASFLAGGSLTVCSSFFIPAGTFVAGDVITIEAILTRIGNTGNLTAAIYWNETNDVINSPVLMGQSSSGVSDNVTPLSRSFAIISSTNTVGMSTSYPQPTDLSSTTDQFLNLALSTITSINWNVDSYIILATSQTCTSRYFRVIK